MYLEPRAPSALFTQLRRTGGKTLFSLLFILTATHSYCAKKPAPSPEKKIHRFMLAMDSGIIEKKALSELKRLTKSKDPAIKSRAIGLLAQYEGEGSGNLIKALTILTPYVLDKKEASAFKRKLIAAKGEKEFLGVIPPASKWKFKEPELCVSMARILAFGGKYSEALAAFDRVGRNREGVPRVIAAEGIGDIQFSLKRWEQCIGSYQFALQSIGYLKKLYQYEEMKGDPIIPALTSRIQRKLSEAKRKWEEEKYGPGYVAYRAARQTEFHKNYLPAVIAYKRITEQFPDTVYGEAAGLYGPKCLFKLALPGQKENIRKNLAQLEKKIEDNKTKLKKYGKMMTIKVRERLKKRIADDLKYYEELRQVPTGKRAEEKAIADLEEFITEPEKLYRLEAMQTLGDYFLEEKIDLESAYKYYGQCYKALEQINELNKKLNSLSNESWKVPAKATSVSRGPEAEKKITGWTGWIEKNPIRPEQIINRQHSSWYLNSIKARTGKMLSLCFFIKGNKEQALKAAKFIIDFEPLEKMMYESGKPNSYYRLIKGYEVGWLRTKPEELASFKGKLLTAVILGDFYYEIENENKCAEIRSHLANGKYGKLSNDQEASAKCRLAEILFRQGENNEKIVEVLKDFQTGKYKGTSSQCSALIGLGNLYLREKKKSNNMEMAIVCYENAAQAAKGIDIETTNFYLGNAYRYAKRHKDAVKAYKKVLKHNPESPHYKDLCIKYIEQSNSK